MINFELIETDETLNNLVVKLSNLKSLAVDIECENNLHHYGAYITLMQLSNRQNNWVVDVLKIKNIEPLLTIFRNQEIQKVFHDVSFDLRIIKTQWNCQVVNIFDTQLAASFTGREKVGLASLLEEFFKIKKDKKYQRFNWTRRPLPESMLSYAVKDSAYLLPLQDKLRMELEKLGRFDWVVEECQNLELQDWNYHEQTYLDVSGVKSLTPQQRSIFHALFDQRKEFAELVDKPPFMIYGNKQMLAFSKNPPSDWVLVKGVHPIVVQKADKMHELVSFACVKGEQLPEKKKNRLSSQQFEWSKELLLLRNKIAQQLGIKGHLLLNNDQIRDISVTQSLDQLRSWQGDLIRNEKLILEIMRA
jgi:ribonuclease D